MRFLKRKTMRIQVQIRETGLATIVVILLFMLSFIFGYFVSWQLGVPTFIFGLSFALLYKLTMLSKKFSPLFLFILGIAFTFTIYSPIHEAIHCFFAYASGAPITKVEWWFLTSSGIQNPYVNIDFTSKNVLSVVISYIAPFLILSVAFITLWSIWYIRKSLWIHFAYVPLSFNFVLSYDDLGLGQNVGLAMGLIVLFLMEIVALYYSKVWKKQSEEAKQKP